jgi:hypothetical protein
MSGAGEWAGELAFAMAVAALPAWAGRYAIGVAIERLMRQQRRAEKRQKRRLPPWTAPGAVARMASRPALDDGTVALLAFGYALAGCSGLFLGAFVFLLVTYS